MKNVDIDVDACTGRFGAGLTWGELDAATQRHGLAVTGGRVTHTGVAGLTLGSGSGWIDRKLGPTCESLLSAEVVTADGRVVRASADENSDLLWGLKGGGGNFGVVTEFEFQLHPVGPIVFAGLILHPRGAAKQLLRVYRDFMEHAPDEVGGGFALLTAPPDTFVPENARGKPAAALILVYVGDPQRGEEIMRPLLDWGEPLVTLVQPMPYVAVQQLIDAANPRGHHGLLQGRLSAGATRRRDRRGNRRGGRGEIALHANHLRAPRGLEIGNTGVPTCCGSAEGNIDGGVFAELREHSAERLGIGVRGPRGPGGGRLPGKTRRKARPGALRVRSPPLFGEAGL